MIGIAFIRNSEEESDACFSRSDLSSACLRQTITPDLRLQLHKGRIIPALTEAHFSPVDLQLWSSVWTP